MNTKIFSLNIVRLLVIITLVIPMALGAISPAQATTSNSVVGWGWNTYGQSNVPPDLTDVVALAGGNTFSLALKSDGTVVGWGGNTQGEITIPTDLAGVIAIDAGQAHSLALKSDGTVVAWGWNFFGQTDVPPGLSDVVAIDAGEWHNLALKSDHTVVAWGDNNYGEINVPPDLTDVVAISAGAFANLALKSDGTLVGWGWNGFGVISIPPDLSGITAFSAGPFHSIALKNDGTVVAWGLNDYGQLNVPAGLTDVVAISAGTLHSLALKSDGTVVAWGASSDGQLTIPAGLSGVTAIEAGGYHNLALVSNEPSNTAPIANPGGPYLGAVNTAISFDGSLSADPDGDFLTYAWDFGDGLTDTGAMPTHSYTNSGLYTVCLTVNDGSLDSDPACTMAVVYDPSEGFVTGGGWINSPAGAYKPDQSLSGHATFGFISKYHKGATVPSGTTAFEFDLAGMAFASLSYEWLVVNQGGSNAQFKGSGLINGSSDPNGNAYKFMIWASDGSASNSADTLRIRIWWEDAAGAQDVYDNGTGLAIGAGNIVVHTNK